MCKWVINQDRDIILKLSNEDSLLVLPVMLEKSCIGFNLRLNEHLLGTFDTLEEAFCELNNLINAKESYFVGGYSL